MEFPSGKTFGLAVTVDYDAQAVWLAKGRDDPSWLARGDYEANVAVPRILRTFERYGVPSTWGVPGHTLKTWPELCREIVAAGHEICAHGVFHENLLGRQRAEEKHLLEWQIAQHLEVLGVRPRGYRAPSGPLTPHTFELLEELGFEWESGTQGGDFEPYRPRRVLSVDPWDRTVYGEEYRIVEFSPSAYLEDWAGLEFVPGSNPGLQDTDVVLRRWCESLDFGIEEVPGGVMNIVLHPQTIGRPHHMKMLYRFLDYATGLPQVHLGTLSEFHDRWIEAEQ